MNGSNINYHLAGKPPVTYYTSFSIPARLKAPTTPAFEYNNENNYEKAVLLGVISDMEYKISTDTDWTSVGNDDIVFDIPTKAATYYVRYKANSENFASNYKSLTLSVRGTAPTPSYNTTTEILSSLTSAMEISYNGSEYTAVESGVTSLDMSEKVTGLTEALTVNIRRSATSTTPASLTKTIVIYPRLTAPTTVAYDKAHVSLTGINSTMQYRLETSTSWTALSGSTLNLLSYASAEKDVKVLVRYKPTTTNSASLPVEFTIPKLVDGPSCSVDYINEKIIGLDDNITYQYYIGTKPSTTATWTAMKTENGSFDISSIAASSSKIINIRKAATSDEPITNYTTLTLPARKTAPTTPAFVYNNSSYYDKAVLTGVTNDMEYRISTDTTWTSVGEEDIVLDIPAKAATYYVRYKSDSENFASLNKSITLSARGTAPTPSYNTTTEILSSLTSAMEISYNGSEYTAVETGITSLDMSEKVTGLTEALTINIRRSATSTVPASLAKTIVINPRLTAPTTVVYNKANFSLTGINKTMQYKFETSTSWTTFSSTTFNLISYASTEKDVKITVRNMATSTNSASLPVEFTIPKLLDGPNCYIDYDNEKIAGLDDNIAYQYYVGTKPTITSSWTTIQTENGNFDISGIISTSSKVVSIRQAATADEPVTNFTTLTLPARKSAPTTPAFVYNSDNYYDKAVLTGVSSDMEYKLSTDLEWRTITGNEVVFDIPDTYNETYYVRYKSSGENFASSYKSIVLYNRSAIPNSVNDEQLGLIIPNDTETDVENDEENVLDSNETISPDLSNTLPSAESNIPTSDLTDESVSDSADESSSDLIDTKFPDNEIYDNNI